MMITRLMSRILIIPVLAICFSCTTVPPKPALEVFPSPPDEPKLALIGIYRGEMDILEKSFLNTLLGNSPSNNLGKPLGVAARKGKIYVTDTGKPRVFIMDPQQRSVTIFGDTGDGKLSLPLGIAVSDEGTIFVSDGQLKKVLVYDESGKLKSIIGAKDGFVNNAGVAYNDELKRLYVVDSYGNAVHVYSGLGERLFQFGKNGPGDGDFFYPTMIAIDRRNGNVVIVDTQHFRVQVFDKDGHFVKKFGQLGDVAGSFTRPKGVGIDSEGNMYVTDAAFDNVQVFNDKTQLLLVLGSAGIYPGYYQVPGAAYVDENDRIYVVDQLNARVQVYQYLSEKWKKEQPDEYKKLEGEIQQKRPVK